MSNFDQNRAAYGYPTATRDQAVIDQGLRSYMLGIYNHMVIGLAITGFAALGIFMLSVTSDPALAAATVRGGKLMLTQFGATLFMSNLKWVIIFAPLAVVLFLSFRADKLSPQAAQGVFWLYAALMGVSLATVLMVYTHTSVARTFFVTAASFGALSLWGYTTKRDLSGMGSFLIMGVFGLLLASIVNIFLASSPLQFAISAIGVLLFAGLTAYDTQRLKSDYVHGYAYADAATAQRASIIGALQLYIDFVGMFQFLLSFMGDRD